MTPPKKIPWTKANQDYLVAEFVRLKTRLGSQTPSPSDGKQTKIRKSRDAPPAIDRLSEVFGLSDFERQIVLLCAGIEMDTELATLCGEAQGRPHRPAVTFGLAMALLPDSHWSALIPQRPLRHFRLVEMEGGQGLTTASLRIDERILHYLAGVNAVDPRLALLRLLPQPEFIAIEHKNIAGQAAEMLARTSEPPLILQFCGDDAAGQEDVAAAAAKNTGLQLFSVNADDLPAPGSELEQFSTLWQREALLLPAALLIQCANGINAAGRHLAERLPETVFISCREPIRFSRTFSRFDIDKPQPAEQKRLWQLALGKSAAELGPAVDEVSAQFRLSARTIASTSALITAGKNRVPPGNLWNACRALARPRLEDLAERIIPLAGWNDLVLPEPQKQILRHLAAQVRHRLTVHETWGFSAKGRRGLGVSALFAGGSGTGKTLAAEVLAHDLALEMYRIDLSAVVSKYIGETEKNLRQVFDAAEEGGVLLLFDEADALFGKRGEVKESHDRYANIEVGYLLQRMESYQGVAILTTNLKSSLDKAFERRLRFTVNFPFPDYAQRGEIWQKIFPAGTPTEGLSHQRLAQLNVSGGSIRNIAVNAAFLAAQAGKPVRMEHLAEAARLESQKIERPLSRAEVQGWE
jgi:hypothetical protein